MKKQNNQIFMTNMPNYSEQLVIGRTPGSSFVFPLTTKYKLSFLRLAEQYTRALHFLI